MRDNNILVRHIKPAARKIGHPLGQLAGSKAILRHLVTNGGNRSTGPAIAHASFPVHDDSRDLRAGSAGVATTSSREVGQSGELATELGQNGTMEPIEVLVSD